ncbi:hypothetical protein [Streptomyces sp. NPDC003077]|uniref:hypothetical protein n=1 Tax=Streptomyces sp. NPDC003077 TaxID=3154443 RepID=UPI0033B1B7B3
MTERGRPAGERSRRTRPRTALTVLVVIAALAVGGVWFSRAADRASTVGAAPKTAAVREGAPGRVATPAPSEGLPGVRDCGFGRPEVRPKVITLTCADAGMVATGLTWERYGVKEAEGKGVVQVVKTAAGAGADAGYPATFRLYGPRTVDGARAFTGLEVSYEGSTPLGEQTETYTLA